MDKKRRDEEMAKVIEAELLYTRNSNIMQAIHEVEMVEQGKLKTKSLKEFIGELESE